MRQEYGNVVWLTVEHILAIHAMSLQRFGGSPGARSAGSIESCLTRPKNFYRYTEPPPTLFELAACYLDAFACGHPFIDGNKRVGILAATAFLFLNGFEFQHSGGDTDIVEMVIGMADNQQSPEELAQWLEKHSVRIL